MKIGARFTSFSGVYSCDTIPKTSLSERQPELAFIVNLAQYASPGTHFIGYVINTSKIIYFDPYGHPCHNKHILNHMRLYNHKDYTYNSRQIQSLDSIHCGIYCLSFIICVSRNISLSVFMAKFHRTKLLSNDNIATALVVKGIRYLAPERSQRHS